MTLRALVVGAGPAGSAAAVHLATCCERVTVAEAGPRERSRRTGEHLPPAGLAELAARGLGDVLADDRHESSPGVLSAWGAGEPVDKEYFGAAAGRGLNLRREAFDAALVRRAERRGVTVLFGTRLRALVPTRDGYTATLSGTGGLRELHADLVVDATGRGAVAARRLGAKRLRCDELVGLVGRVAGCRPVDEPGRVRVESVEDGWWYGVPFSDGTLLATFMTDASCVRNHPGRARGLWRERLRSSRLLGPLAGTGRWAGRLQVVDAATQVLECDARDGFLAVGDAAAAYDPLSSWGITKGVCDGLAGAEALVRARHGDGTAAAAHRSRQRHDFETHRAVQREFYRAETRWPASPFWRSRRSVRELRAS